jgi:predicted ATPase/DNA-binding NarL/FixJ family response regulator
LLQKQGVSVSLLHDSEIASRLPAQHTSFIGRERELAALLDMLREPAIQLVTLTGPGGVGKTRLAERITSEMTASTGYELIWISLAPLETTEQVAQAIGQQFGLKGVGPESLPDRLASTLLGRSVLIVLDNFEHLLSAAPMTAELLEACPTLTVLATSRGPLNITWERVVAVDPLPLPPAHASQLEIEANPAVRLFLERASNSGKEKPVSLEELQTIGAICQRLDGLPLAIELAAPWRRLLTAAELLARLDRRLPLLMGGPADSPDRLRSMGSAIAWSYALLDPDARRLFRHLSIFPGAFTLEAAEFLSSAMQPASATVDPAGQRSDQVAILSALASLVNQGVVLRGEQHGFRMLQTIREYGLGILEERRELDQCGWAHLAWCVSRTSEPVFDPLDGYLWGPAGRSEDQADLAAALSFALDRGEYVSSLRLAVALSPVWAAQGRYTEARNALERIQEGLPDTAAEIRAVVLGWIAEWAWLQGDYSSTGKLAQASLDASEALGMPRAIAANRYRLGRVATLDDPQAAPPLLLEALGRFRALEEPRNICWCLVGLGHAALGTGDEGAARAWFDEAEANLDAVDKDSGKWLTLGLKLGVARLALHTDDHARAGEVLFEALAISREERNHYFESLCLSYLCDVHRREKSFAKAVEAGRQGLQIAQMLGHRFRERQCLVQLVRAALDAGKIEQAMLLEGGVAALGAQLDIAIIDESLVDRSSVLAPKQATRLAELQSTGRKLTGSELLAQVMALELELKHVPQRSNVLSNREEEVLRILAQGATNGEIADRLYVSRRTVDTHVGSILRKLHAASRHEAVKTARKHGIVDPEEPIS